MITKKIVLLFILMFGCVEHKYNFTVSPDGSYSFKYHAHGDEHDMIDLDVPMPVGFGWSVNSNLGKKSDSYDYTAKKFFEKNEPFPASFYMEDSLYFSSLLLHPVKIKYKNWFFKRIYIVSAQFKSRQVLSKYPKVKSIIKDIENPENGWAADIFNYLFSETLMRTPLEFNQHGIIFSELKRWINEEIANLPDSILISDFNNYKEVGLDIIMQPISPIHYDFMDSVFKQLEDEVRITLDLIDDEFEFYVILPGNIKSYNAGIKQADTLLWKFTLEDFFSEDYNISAISEITYHKRIKYLLFVCIIIILLSFIFLKRD